MHSAKSQSNEFPLIRYCLLMKAILISPSLSAGGQEVRRDERYILLYGYVGCAFHGSQRNAESDEASCPTVEGALLKAVRQVALSQAGATNAQTEIHSRTSRTDRGVHALANVVHVRLSTQFGAGSGAPPPVRLVTFSFCAHY
eukprot:SAG31_NODE_706_length_12688_cov_41.991342_1_plen_143_part_00